MYSIVFHAHQKIDRVASKHLRELLPRRHHFPPIRLILSFEGKQGPDRAKLKHRPGDQPWHFVNPNDAASSSELFSSIDHHYKQLVAALKKADQTKAAFEAAWLAHALVDGLTPAHHYPYEAELANLRGEDRQTRRGLLGRLYVHGDNFLTSLLRSLKLVGPKGLLTTHTTFEGGAFVIMSPLTLDNARPSRDEIDHLKKDGLIATYQQLLAEVDHLKIYDRFIHHGWSHSVGRDVRVEMAPRMVKAVTLAWLSAYNEAK